MLKIISASTGGMIARGITEVFTEKKPVPLSIGQTRIPH
jgi:hypothetical protein